MKLTSFILVVGSITTSLFEPTAIVHAQDSLTSDPGLEDRVQTLDQEIRILKRQRELEREAENEKEKEAPVIGTGAAGFFFRSGDGANLIRLRGLVQTDGRFFQDSRSVGQTTFRLRRVRPIFEGTVFNYFDFRIVQDFGEGVTVLQDAYVDLRLSRGVVIRAGKFKSPVGLERLQSANDITFVERGFPTSLLPNRDVGIQISGEISELSLNYALALTDGVPDGGSVDLDNNDQKDASVRLFFIPFRLSDSGLLKGLGFGGSGTYGKPTGTPASYKTLGQQTFFSYRSTVAADGIAYRVSPQAYWYVGPVGLLGEYALSGRDLKVGGTSTLLKTSAWQGVASFVVTGGGASYRGVKPTRPFDPAKGAWGEVELAARYTTLKADERAFPLFADAAASPRRADGWDVALNWYLNGNFKFTVDYARTTFKDGAVSGGERPDEEVVFTRFQIAY